MLCQFTMKNYKSIREEMTFDMQATAIMEHRDRIIKTEDGEGIVDSIETLKEMIRVKLKDGDDIFYKKYPVSEVKIIKNVGKEEVDQEEREHLKELQELEKLEKMEKQASNEDDM